MKCIQLNPHQRLASLPRDKYVKHDVAYLLVDRTQECCVLAQSLPLLAKWVNQNVSSGDRCDRVSLTGLHENLNRPTDCRNGGWHKGRYRVTSMPLADSAEAFDAARREHNHAAIIGHTIQARKPSG